MSAHGFVGEPVEAWVPDTSRPCRWSPGSPRTGVAFVSPEHQGLASFSQRHPAEVGTLRVAEGSNRNGGREPGNGSLEKI